MCDFHLTYRNFSCFLKSDFLLSWILHLIYIRWFIICTLGTWVQCSLSADLRLQWKVTARPRGWSNQSSLQTRFRPLCNQQTTDGCKLSDSKLISTVFLSKLRLRLCLVPCSCRWLLQQLKVPLLDHTITPGVAWAEDKMTEYLSLYTWLT